MASYLALAFGLAWLCQIPVYATDLDGLPALVLLAFGGIAPTVAAVIVTRGQVWRDTWRGPRPARLLLIAFLLPSAMVLATGAITGDLRFHAPSWGPVLLPPIGEELGWRGYLQAKLRDRFSFATASLLTGVAWALWHLPTAIGHFETFPPYALGVIAASFVVGWLWERGDRSTLIAVAFHAGINLGVVRTTPGATPIAWVLLALLALAAARSFTPARARAASTS